MDKFDEYDEYAAILELALEFQKLYLQEDLVKPDGILDPAGCTLNKPCSKCQYDSLIERLADLESRMQYDD